MEENAGLVAIKDRAMAYWTDPANFESCNDTKEMPIKKRLAMIWSLGIGAGLFGSFFS